MKHPKYGAAASELYEHAQELLGRIIESKLLRARGSYGFWPANSDGDDIILYTDESRTSELLRFNMLRQQEAMPSGQPNRSLADFVAPRSSGVADYLGAFAVTGGLGADELVKRYEKQHDDYRAIMVKALADRLAEAFAEYLHARVRREWGYGATEVLTNDDLIHEKYRGIRPAFGYPACPDHTEKIKLFDLLAAERAGIKLTESCAMTPAASVSGIYLSHPEARYFMLGRIGRDQLEDYAARKRQPVEESQRWIAEHVDEREPLPHRRQWITRDSQRSVISQGFYGNLRRMSLLRRAARAVCRSERRVDAEVRRRLRGLLSADGSDGGDRGR